MKKAIEIAHGLLSIGAIQLKPEDPFTWSSGWLSPIYCDNRVALSHPSVRNIIIESFIDNIPSHSLFDVIAGVATAGIPWASIVADRIGKPLVYVRSKAKDHGRKNQIEGTIASGSRVIVFEDLISTGGSSIAAIKALQQEGAEILNTLAIFDYQMTKALEAYQAIGIPFVTLSNYQHLLKAAHEINLISENHLETLLQWRIDPANWSPM